MDVHREIANDMERDLGPMILRCDRCGKEQTPDVAGHLLYGWPECCGETMKLSRVKP
jgi:hypothetical protein